MRRLGVLVGIVLAGSVLAASAAAAPGSSTVHLRPAATSVDHAPSCDLPDAPVLDVGPGATGVTFTILPAGCG